MTVWQQVSKDRTYTDFECFAGIEGRLTRGPHGWYTVAPDDGGPGWCSACYARPGKALGVLRTQLERRGR